MITHLETPSDCRICATWNYDPSNDSFFFGPPKDYPVEEIPPNGKLRPMKLTFNLLRMALDKVPTKIVNGDWSLAAAKAYLSVFCISDAIVMDIAAQADSCHVFLDAKAAHSNDPDALLKLRSSNDKILLNMWCIQPLQFGIGMWS